MIRINATTHSVGGITISSGSVLDVKPHLITKRIDDGGKISVEYGVAFDVAIYKSLTSYEANEPILINSRMKEYNIGYTLNNVDLLALDSVTALLDILMKAIEDGSEGYPGVGSGKCEVVYPFAS